MTMQHYTTISAQITDVSHADTNAVKPRHKVRGKDPQENWPIPSL